MGVTFCRKCGLEPGRGPATICPTSRKKEHGWLTMEDPFCSRCGKAPGCAEPCPCTGDRQHRWSEKTKK